MVQKEAVPIYAAESPSGKYQSNWLVYGTAILLIIFKMGIKKPPRLVGISTRLVIQHYKYTDIILNNNGRCGFFSIFHVSLESNFVFI